MVINASLVSVLIRTFNRPVTLAKAVDSVLQQTHRPLEIVLVNDGGEDPDSGLEILASQQQVQFTLINLAENEGRSNAANVALKIAQGEALLFLDDDDWIDPDHIARLLPVLYGSSELIAAYSDTACVSSADKPKVTKVFNSEFDSLRLAFENYLPIHSVLFKNNELSQACKFNSELDVYEDWSFWIQLASKGAMQRVPGITAWYSAQLSGVGFGHESQDYSLELAKFFKLTVPFYSPEQISVMLFMCRNFTKLAETNKYNESVVAELQEKEARSSGFFKKTLKKSLTLLRLLKNGDFQGIRTRFVRNAGNLIGNTYHPARINVKGGIGILCTPHTLFVAKLIRKHLEAYGLIVNSIIDQEPKHYDSCLYLVICPQLFKKLPRRYMVFQMEQSVSPRWFDTKYVAILKKAEVILDYSKDNLGYLQKELGVKFSNLYYFPISNLPTASLQTLGSCNQKYQQYEYDVVFYGDVQNPRRKQFLDAISKKFKTLIVSEVFGEALYIQLRRAKVLVNIHYYENALLETTRIYESLSLGLNIISEVAIDQLDHAVLMPWVTFTPMGDIDAMLNAIDEQLKQPRNLAELPVDLAAANFHMGRMLIGLEIIKPEDAKLLPPILSKQALSQPLCLSMPESYERHVAFRYKYPKVAAFHGLRFNLGWIGCALSYSYLAQQALQLGSSHLEVWEDDVILTSAALERWQAAKAVFISLESSPKKCDLLSGLLADVSTATQVLDFFEIQGETYVVIDRMVSTVCNFYGNKALTYLAEWSPRIHDVRINTIDRYLERKDMHVLVPLPFVAGHNPEQDSTLWGINNSHYDTMIETAQAKLYQKLEQFKLKRTEDVSID